MIKTFGGRIRLLHWGTSQAMNESLARIGLTSAQGRIMFRLMHSKAHLRARDIEREFCLSHPTVSGPGGQALQAHLCAGQGFGILILNERDH